MHKNGASRLSDWHRLILVGCLLVASTVALLILLGCLCFGSGLGGSFLARRAAAAASGLLGGLFLLAKESLVVVNELNEASLSVVAKTVTHLEDASVSTGTVGDLLSYLVEQNANCVLVL